MAAERDTAMIGHASARQAARSPSLTRSSTQGRRTSISKRSPSPIVTFHSAPENGVQSITRKVIRRLEGLGHLDELEADSPSPEDDEMEAEKALDALASTNGHGNGKATQAKVDYEIPRKVLHSSIGVCFAP
jgi:diacylglycerol kinase (CTP)